MIDWTEATKHLKAPLDPAAIKPPPSGKFGEYVDGLHVIREANRIFGHDGWSYEITRLEMVSRITTAKPQIRVGYMATVKVTVDGVVREGSAMGSGMGNPDNEADAHESAIKEAETDAMKRAMRTFGNTFGLALYDKDKASREVSRPPTVKERIDAAATLEDINGLIADVAALDNANATRDLHEKATALGFVGDKETKRYKTKPQEVAA
jgi:DNA repair and recombination protein RAD52